VGSGIFAIGIAGLENRGLALFVAGLPAVDPIEKFTLPLPDMNGPCPETDTSDLART
jgi:hypothetical protein